MNATFDELIEKYLKRTLEENEKQLLAAMLKVPENQLYLASRIDAAFFDESLEEMGDDGTGTQIFQHIREKIKEPMPEQEGIRQPARLVQMPWYRRKTVRAIAVAVSIILAVGFGIVLLTNNRPNQLPVAVQNNKTDSSTLSFIKHQVNTTGKEESIQLPDGSLIVLADGGEVTYREPFLGERGVVLAGKAWFKVAKDKTRPFTVTSGEITTTVLGTEFTVTAHKNEKQIVVRLYEGKVVVKPVDRANKKIKQDFYLLPGQAFVYDGTTARVKIFRLTNIHTPEKAMNEDTEYDNPSIPQNTKGSWYMFNNQSLEQVLHELEAFYNVRIVYNSQDVQNIYFTGKYNRSEPLEAILKRIGIVNNLTITKNDTAFIISR